MPEVVTRIRRVIGDDVRGDDDPALAQQLADGYAPHPDGPLEAHSSVLLCGYSQGSPIAVAVMAQLPAAARARVGLLTLAAPIRRLYGRTFPAYYGPQQLELLSDSLTEAGSTRWRNLVRRSDYIGGWAVQPPSTPPDSTSSEIDHEILDPPVLWLDGNPSPPPAHLHSDWFPDPQTRPYAALVGGLLIGGGKRPEQGE
ncbi:MAG: hypothetical protein ACR2KJ_16755 [Jatrophihabitans sp.]